VTLPWIIAAAAAGLLPGPSIRASVFARGTEDSRPRRASPESSRQVLAGRWLWCSVLPVTGRCLHCKAGIGPYVLAAELVTALALAVIAPRVVRLGVGGPGLAGADRRPGLDTGRASFETAAPDWEAFDAAKLPGHRLAAADADGRVLGWVAVSPVSARRVYAGVVEHSVYVLPGCHRRGIGAALLRALIGSTEAAGIWTIQSSLFPENTASVRLHQQAGFRILGTRERIACHHGRWRDSVIVERRSAIAGTG
jgi:L-amino acid N-acyltransferase YncA